MSKAVITIHGFLTTTQDFGCLNDYLADYDEIAVVQIPGHNGKTDFSLFTKQSTVNVLLSTFDDLAKKHQQIDVIGFSMGGALAQYLCVKRNVNKVVLMAPSNKFFNVKFPFEWTKFFFSLKKSSGANASGTKREKAKFARMQAQPYWKDVVGSLAMAFNRLLPNISLATFSTFSYMMKMVNNAVIQANAIETPTLLVYGKQDELISLSSVCFVQKHFSNVQVKSYNGVGHGLLYSHLDKQIIGDIVGFLSNNNDVI